MAEIGAKGGEAVSRDRKHMAEIGAKGGEARGGASSNAGQQSDGGNKGETRGGTSEQHARAGSQSHKNRGNEQQPGA